MADDNGPVLDQLNIVVRDMAAAVEFYRHLGLTIDDVTGEWAHWADHHRTARTSGGLDFDLDSVQSAKGWNQAQTDDRTGPIIGFRLPTREAVDERYAAVTGAGYQGLQPPFDAFWGARYAIVEDPEGNPVGLMSPVDPARRTPPPG
jgi:predicted enzyme related to lactoylglutathione lyase